MVSFPRSGALAAGLAVVLVVLAAAIFYFASDRQSSSDPKGADTGATSITPSRTIPSEHGQPRKRHRECLPGPARADSGRGSVVYFVCTSTLRPEAVVRQVGRSNNPAQRLRLVLRAWLQGPTAQEERLGLLAPSVISSQHPPTVSFKRRGVLLIDFSARTFPTGGLTATQAIGVLDPLREMIFDTPRVRLAHLTVGGACDAFWTLMERECMPMTAAVGPPD